MAVGRALYGSPDALEAAAITLAERVIAAPSEVEPNTIQLFDEWKPPGSAHTLLPCAVVKLRPQAELDAILQVQCAPTGPSLTS